jgi:hypothetical protein
LVDIEDFKTGLTQEIKDPIRNHIKTWENELLTQD